MSVNNSAADVSDAVAAPIGDIIASIGKGIAEAQEALDDQSMRQFRKMYSDPKLDEMRRMGYQPTFYRIPELEADITLTLSIGVQSQQAGQIQGSNPADTPVGGNKRLQLYATPADASYANKYDFSASVASRVKFKVVAVPPSAQAEDAKIVPILPETTRAEAEALLREMNLPYGFEDDKNKPRPDEKVVTVQAAGTPLKPGEKVMLRLRKLGG